MAKIGDVIRLHRERRGWSQERLASEARVSKGTVQNLEGAKTKASGATVWACVRALGFETAEEAARAAGAIRTPRTRGDPDRTVPVINQAPAGNVRNLDETGIDSGVGFTYIPRGDLEGDNLFAVVITGDSMIPRLGEGDTVVFLPVLNDPNADLADGDVVFVRFTPEFKDGCTVAYYRRLPDGSIRFEKHNPRYAPITCRPDDLIQLAVAIQRREQMKLIRPAGHRRLARGSDADISG